MLIIVITLNRQSFEDKIKVVYTFIYKKKNYELESILRIRSISK